MYKKLLPACALSALVFACIEPFSPPEVSSPETYLVVDGFLNVGNDTSRIELRRTQNTNDQSKFTPEMGAKLSVAGESGEVYDFNEEGNGIYYLPPVNVSTTGKYQLMIKTLNGKSYLSENVPVVTTPPIDDLTYQYDQGRDAMVIKVNTHDPQNNTRFYKWKFEETYEYRAAYQSSLIFDSEKKEIVFRKEDINLCWKTNKSTNIMLGNTIRLSADIIKELPLAVVPINSNKMHIKYSILVRQYGLSREGFEYWTNLAKTTQGTGSLFDPQPSQITGNIKNTADPKELVFGYFSASTVTSKRIFMSPGLGSHPRCDPPDSVTIGDVLKSPGYMMLHFAGRNSEFVLVTSSGCADCRVHGGTTTKPSFWE